MEKAYKEIGLTREELSRYFGVSLKIVSEWEIQKRALPKNFEMIIDLAKDKKELEFLQKKVTILKPI
jgi:DNA-binding transcriptional regulator YiaG